MSLKNFKVFVHMWVTGICISTTAGYASLIIPESSSNVTFFDVNKSEISMVFNGKRTDRLEYGEKIEISNVGCVHDKSDVSEIWINGSANLKTVLVFLGNLRTDIYLNLSGVENILFIWVQNEFNIVEKGAGLQVLKTMKIMFSSRELYDKYRNILREQFKDFICDKKLEDLNLIDIWKRRGFDPLYELELKRKTPTLIMESKFSSGMDDVD